MDRATAIEKVKKLLRLSKSSNEHEAAAAMRQAQALMRQHQIEEAEAAGAAAEIDPIEEVASDARRGKTTPVDLAALASLIAEAFGTRTFARASKPLLSGSGRPRRGSSGPRRAQNCPPTRSTCCTDSSAQRSASICAESRIRRTVRPVETRFKPGRLAFEAANYLPIGTTRVNHGYLMRKVTDDPALFPATRWEPEHRLVWIAAHGAIPPGHVVAFRPGLRTLVESEITLDRLELISREENARRNRGHHYPPELKQAIRALRQLRRRIQEAQS